MNGMNVYTDGTVWVVAHSQMEASYVVVGDDDAEDAAVDFRQVPDDSILTVEDCDPIDDNDDVEETKTCREWADSFTEPGILASTEDQL